MTDLALLVPGGTGQLGKDLARLAPGPCQAPGSAALDVTDEQAVRRHVAALAGAAEEAGFAPVVVNAAAHTAVDAAESEPDAAYAVNERGPRLLAAACAEHGVPLLHVSTDYVFSGDADRPYEPDDEPGPRSVYGKSKLAGEHAVLAYPGTYAVRTSWVYGATGGNFVKTMCRLERERDTLAVVDDQHGSPTWSADLARGLLELAAVVASGRRPPRVLHATGGGHTTWHGLTRAVFEELGADPARVHPCPSSAFTRPAPRPTYSVLSSARWHSAGLTPLPQWRGALSSYFHTRPDTPSVGAPSSGCSGLYSKG
jgi:dTDP-4-dehydrorhamnose reductase